MSGHVGWKRWLRKLGRSGEELGPFYPNCSALYPFMCRLLWKCSQLEWLVIFNSLHLAPISILWFGFGFVLFLQTSVRCSFDFDLTPSWLSPQPPHAREHLTSPLQFLQPLLQSDSTTICYAYTSWEPGVLGKLNTGGPLCLDHQLDMIFALSG